MRKAKSCATLAAKKAAAQTAAKAAAARAATKAAAGKRAMRAASTLLSAALKRIDDGMFGVQAVIASSVLFLMTAGYKFATQFHPPDWWSSRGSCFGVDLRSNQVL